MGIWDVSRFWLNFLALFLHFLRFRSGATYYKQWVVAKGWLTEKDRIDSTGVQYQEERNRSHVTYYI